MRRACEQGRSTLAATVRTGTSHYDNSSGILPEIYYRHGLLSTERAEGAIRGRQTNSVKDRRSLPTAFKLNRDKRVVLGLIALGLVIPLVLLYL
jgi:hypothetical protein